MKIAEVDGITKLRDRCRAVEHAAASAADEQARYERIRRNRSLRHWSDDDGTFRLDGHLTPEAGAKLLGALAPFEKAAFDAARLDGRHEPPDAYRADALEAMADASLTGLESDDDQPGEPPRSRKPAFTVLVDIQALLRGHTEPGETCEIPGVGPVPVSLLHEYGGDAIWHCLVTCGVDIRAYCSLTRHIPTMLRVALDARDRECIAPGCTTTTGLQIDHLVPVEDHGPTTYTNLGRICHHDHHEKKHRQGWTLAGGPDNWTFTPPELGEPP